MHMSSSSLYSGSMEQIRCIIVAFISESDVHIQVKLRGMRIELSEIESALSTSSEVRTCAVKICTRTDTAGSAQQQCLVAYVTPPNADTTAILQAVKKQLPQHMVPQAIVPLETIPQMVNGKFDLARLPSPDWDALAAGDKYIAPSSETEHRAHELWSEVLNLPRIGIHTDFFSVGGTSLLAGLLAMRLNEAFGINETATLVFEQPTIAEQAERVLSLKQSGDLAPVAPIPLAPYTPEDKAAGVPCSFAQEQMLSVAMGTSSLAYNQHFMFELGPAVGVTTLQAAFSMVAERQEAMRTCFAWHAAGPRQVVKQDCDVRLQVVGVKQPSSFRMVGRPEGEPGSARALGRSSMKGEIADNEPLAKTALFADAETGFDLTAAPLIRATLVQVQPCCHIVASSWHHHFSFSSMQSKNCFFSLSTMYLIIPAASVTREPLRKHASLSYCMSLSMHPAAFLHLFSSATAEMASGCHWMLPDNVVGVPLS